MNSIFIIIDTQDLSFWASNKNKAAWASKRDAKNAWQLHKSRYSHGYAGTFDKQERFIIKELFLPAVAPEVFEL